MEVPLQLVTFSLPVRIYALVVHRRRYLFVGFEMFMPREKTAG